VIRVRIGHIQPQAACEHVAYARPQSNVVEKASCGASDVTIITLLRINAKQRWQQKAPNHGVHAVNFSVRDF
jgi:hypothetical protein